MRSSITSGAVSRERPRERERRRQLAESSLMSATVTVTVCGGVAGPAALGALEAGRRRRDQRPGAAAEPVPGGAEDRTLRPPDRSTGKLTTGHGLGQWKSVWMEPLLPLPFPPVVQN